MRPLLLTIFLVAAPIVASANTALERLQMMSDAMQNKNYTGTYVYMHGDMVETLHISHMRDAGGERERLVSLNGEAREIIRDNSSVTCVWPGSKAVIVSQSQPRTPFAEWVSGGLDSIVKWYDLSILGTDRVAGRDSTVIGIIPKDTFRYGHKIWVDSENSLLLRSQMLDLRGQPVEQVMFTDMQVAENLVAEQFVPSLNQGYEWQKLDGDASDGPFFVAWVFKELPTGFVRVSELVKPMGKNGRPTHHVTLSDGIASVSVYIEASQGVETSLRGESQIGAMSAYGRSVEGIQITVVGEVPMATAAYIGQSVKLATAN